MKRISTTTKHTDKFGAGKHGFRAGDPGGGVLATVLEPDWFDHVQEEIANVIEATGEALDAGDRTQLITAIEAIVADAIGSVAKPGVDVPFLAGFKADFTGEDVAVQTYGRVVAARAMLLLGEKAHIVTAPTGADLILDITRNGTSIYTTKPKFAAGSTVLTAGVLDGAQDDVAVGDVLDFKITQRGSSVRGQQVAFTLKGREV